MLMMRDTRPLTQSNAVLAENQARWRAAVKLMNDPTRSQDSREYWAEQKERCETFAAHYGQELTDEQETA